MTNSSQKDVPDLEVRIFMACIPSGLHIRKASAPSSRDKNERAAIMRKPVFVFFAYAKTKVHISCVV